MTTAARNWRFSSNVTNHYVTRNRWTGEVWSQGTITYPRRYKESVRPQSTSNARRPDGTRANGSWSHQWAETSQAGGTASADTGAAGRITSRGAVLLSGASGDPDSSLVEGLMRNARLKALNKAVADTTQLNAALAQSRDVVTMSADYTRRAARALDKAWDANPKAMKRWATGAVKNIPDHYLAYLYGIAPLADDIANGLNQLSLYRENGMMMSMILRAQEKLRDTVTHINALQIGPETAGITIPCRRDTVCRVGYRFDVPSWYLDNAPVVAPFSTAYELTRMSFVLDWFLPIGNWIGALESAQFSPFFREGWEVWKVTETGLLSQADVFPELRYRKIDFKISGRYTRGKTVRTVVNTYPSSILTRPALKPFPGIQQVSQGLSLLTQALKRRQ